MKVPHSVVGRTQPSSQPLGYLSDAAAQGIASFGQVGRNLAQFGSALAERQQRTERFASLRSFSEFETAASADIAAMQRDSAPDDANFLARVQATYDNAERKFISTLPPAVQDEFTARAGEFRQRILGNALDFQYKSQDAFYRKGIDEEYQRGLQGLDPKLGGDPAALENYRQRIYETIDTSDLAEAEKADLKKKVALGLEGVVYKSTLTQQFKDGGPMGSIDSSVGGIIDAAAARYGIDPKEARAMAWIESRGDPNAVSPTGATGLFQFTQGTARDYGLADRKNPEANADAAMRLFRDNKEGLRKALGREPTFGEVYLAHQQGLGGAVALLSDPSRLATDVVGTEAVRVNGGAPGMTAGQFAALWIKKANAAIGQANIDDDPRFASVPYEDRLALRQDAAADATRQINAENAEAKAEHQTRLNDLFVGLNDGTKGQKDIEDARQSWLGDFDEIKKAQDILKAANAAGATLADAHVKLRQGEAAVWDPLSTDDKKMSDALFAQRGPEALEAADQEYVRNGLAPMVQMTHLIPPQALGMLTGMVRSSDPKRSLFAFNTLAMLQDADPRAFDAQVPESLANDVQYWRDRKDSVPAEELAQALQGGRNPQERATRLALRQEATEYLNQKKDGVPKIKDLVTSVVGDFGGWSSDPNVSQIPWAARGLERDFRTAFVDEYERRGNVDEATVAAEKRLQRQWAVTPIGGQNTLMKYPPEKVGYPKIEGSYDWIDRQVRQETGIPATEKFQLLSDDQTRQELNGQTPPSYMIVRTDADGVPHLQLDKDGQPYRIFFQPTAEDRAREERSFNRRNAEEALREFDRQNEGAQLLYIQRGEAIPQELRDERKRLEDNVKRFAPAEGPPIEAPTSDQLPIQQYGTEFGG